MRNLFLLKHLKKLTIVKRAIASFNQYAVQFQQTSFALRMPPENVISYGKKFIILRIFSQFKLLENSEFNDNSIPYDFSKGPSLYYVRVF